MNSKRSLRKVSIYLFFGICLILIGYVIFFNNSSEKVEEGPSPTPTAYFTQFTLAKVTKVYDGDTIQIDSGVKVRYIGVDSSEIYPVVQCYSQEAKKENEKLVLGKDVKIIKDVSETDKYGRLLGYVYVGDVFVNDELIKNGYAKVMTVPPDIKYKKEFLESQYFAKANNLGLWSHCF